MPDITFRNKKIFYRTAGQGPAVVLLHGFGEDGQVFNRQISFLKEHYTLIVPDLPGSGQSQMLDEQPQLDDFAELLNDLMTQELGDQSCSLFGHSMGGYTTMAFVERYAERLDTFGLIHSSSFADTPEKIESRKKAIDFINRQGGRAFLKTIVGDLFSGDSKQQHPGYPDELLKLTEEISDAALIQYYRAMIDRPDRSSLLKSAAVPVLFLIGKHDKAIPYELSLKQCHLPTVSSVHILENSGHMGMWEETDKTNQAIHGFLQDFL